MLFLSHKRYSFRILATSFIPNLIGAAFILIYFLFFNLSTPIEQKNLILPLLLTGFVFLANILYSLDRGRKWKKLLNKKKQSGLDEDESNLLKKMTLNIPFLTLSVTLLAWFLAGISIPLGFLIKGLSFSEAFQLFIQIFLIGGSLSAVITFYLNDMLTRKTILELFPNDDFEEITGIKNIRFSVRMMIAFWVGGIFPVIMALFFSKNYISRLLLEPENHSMILKYRILMLFVLALSIIMSFLSSFYFRRQIGKPLSILEKKMKEVENGNFEISLPVSQKDEIGNVYGSFNRMVKGLKEREHIKDTFGKFVSNTVRDEILKGSLKLGGEKKEASILFCDIRNFTSISESLKASEVVDLLNSYFNELVRPIFENNGILDKFIGDAVMAVFGVPQTDPMHAKKALICAIIMIEKLKEFNKIREIKGEHPIAIGIGINSGEVIAGNIGSSERMEYTVIGDHVNIASRLESLTKEYQAQILISEFTYQLVKNEPEFDFQEIGAVTVKGKTKAFKAYRVNLKIPLKQGD